MSLASIDGVLPSAIKKLLVGELPGIKSSHISEGLAAGCGYRSNTAYLADLKSGHVRFVSTGNLDGAAMTERLTAILGTDLIQTQNLVFGALARIGMHVSGDIVPVGMTSTLSLPEVPRSVSFSYDPMTEAICSRLPESDPTTLARQRELVAVLVAAVRWYCEPNGCKPVLGHISEGLHLDAFTYLTDSRTVAFRALPTALRASARAYISALPGNPDRFHNVDSDVDEVTRSTHERIAQGVADALSSVRRQGVTLAGWARESSTSMFPPFPRKMSLDRYRRHVEYTRERKHREVAESSWNTDHILLGRLVDAVIDIVEALHPQETMDNYRLRQYADYDSIFASSHFPKVAVYLGTLSKLEDADIDARAFHRDIEAAFGELGVPKEIPGDLELPTLTFD